MLFDLSVAFDTISHNILLDRLASIGITYTPLPWFKSYLSGHTQFIQLFCSSFIYFLSGNIFHKCTIHFDCYLDDTQLYLSSKPTSTLPLTSLSDCLQEIQFLVLLQLSKTKHNKSEVLLIGIKTTLTVFPLPSITPPPSPLRLRVWVSSLTAHYHSKLTSITSPGLPSTIHATPTASAHPSGPVVRPSLFTPWLHHASITATPFSLVSLSSPSVNLHHH